MNFYLETIDDKLLAHATKVVRGKEAHKKSSLRAHAMILIPSIRTNNAGYLINNSLVLLHKNGF